MTNPLILKEKTYSFAELEQFKQDNSILRTIDLVGNQLVELYEIHYPDRPSVTEVEAIQWYQSEFGANSREIMGDWIYFPWSGDLLHVVKEEDLYELRTNRNKLLITKSEQMQLAQSCVAFAGLSIGSHFISSLVYGGIGQTIKLADFDTLSTTNLNRVGSTLLDVGKPKIEMVAQQLYEINPYQDFELYPQGITQQNMNEFLGGERRPIAVFEAVDDFKLKIELRIAARERGIPVIMLTNLGDTILLDVERYDLDPNLPLFNGLIGQTPEKILQQPVSNKDKIQYAIDIISMDNTPTRAIETLLEIGTTLVGRPQLYSTVVISGGIASYLVRRLVLGKSLPSGRTRISLKEVLNFSDDTDSGDREKYVLKMQQKLKD